MQGVKRYYGQTPQARLAHANGSVARWALSRVEDLHGNYYEVRYLKDEQYNQLYPSEILYTLGNGRSEWDARRVTFFYDSIRTDFTWGYENGLKTATRNRLIRIDITAGNVIRSYGFSYEYGVFSKKSRLISLSELGKNRNILQTERFSWLDQVQNYDYASNVTNSWGLSASQWSDANYSLANGDFNGDGRTDLLLQPRAAGNNTWLLLADQAGSYHYPQNITNSFGLNANLWLANNHNLQVVDWNGDGFDDILLQGLAPAQNSYLILANGTGSFQAVQDVSVITGIAANELQAQRNLLQVNDFNGDGYADLLLAAQFLDQPSYFLESNGNGGFKTLRNINNAWGVGAHIAAVANPNLIYGYQFTAVDLNNDGRSDFILQAMDPAVPTLRVLSSPNGYGSATNISNSYGLSQAAWSMSAHQITTVDVNGDHLSDLLLQPATAANNAYILINNGQGGFETVQNVTNSWGMNSTLWAAENSTLYPVNLQGNGRSGLLVLSKTAGGASYLLEGDDQNWFEVASNLNGWRGISQAEWSEANSAPMVGDFDGNGSIDLVLRPKNSGNAKFLATQAVLVDKISKMTTGTGATEEISYQLNFQHAGAIQPGQGVGVADTSPSYLAVSLKVDDGVNPATISDYQFVNKRNIRGVGFDFKSLGFAKMIKSDRVLGTRQELSFMQSPPYEGQLESIALFDEQNHLFFSEVNQYQIATHPQYPGVSAIHKISSQSNTFENQLLTLEKITQTSFAAMGQVESETVCTNGRCVLETKTYAADLSAWNLDKIIENQIIEQGNILSALRRSYQGNDLIQLEMLLCNDTQSCSWSSGSWTALLQNMVYDASGNVTYLEDGNGNGKSLSYDSTYHQFVVQETNALGHKLNRSFDPAGLLLSETDFNGNPTELFYDEYGRNIKISLPNGGEILRSYSSQGVPSEYWIQVDKLVSGLGEPLRYQTEIVWLDGFGKPYKSKKTGDNGWVVQETQIQQSYGRTIELSSLPYYEGDQIHWIKTTKNAKGQPISILDVDGNTTTLNYQPGRMIMNAPGGKITTRELNAEGKITKIVDPLGGITLYEYDGLGNMVHTFGPDGMEIYYTYDSRGNATSLQDASVGRVTAKYDAVGNLLSKADAAGKTINIKYDELNRPVSKILSDGQTTTIEYDDSAIPNGIGRLSRVIEKNVIQEFAYDSLGQKTKEATQILGLPGIQISQWIYDLSGRERTRILPGLGRELPVRQEMEYTPGGNLAKILVNGMAVAEFRNYTATGVFRQKVLNPGQESEVNTFYSYKPNKTLNTMRIVDSQGADIQNINYNYDPSGNILSIVDNLGGMEGQTYAYDALNRLVAANGAYGQKNYAYNQGGNMVVMGGLRNQNLVYDGHRVVSGDGLELRYDLAGNVIQKFQMVSVMPSNTAASHWDDDHQQRSNQAQWAARFLSSKDKKEKGKKEKDLRQEIGEALEGQTWDYVYDAENRLIAVYLNGKIRQEMIYDYTGRRVHRKVYRKGGRAVHTFYPAEGVEVRGDDTSNRIRMTYIIEAQGVGKIASFGKQFSGEQLRETSQSYAGYANFFDDNHPKGWLLAGWYGIMAKMHQPRVLALALPALLALCSLLVMLVVAWSWHRDRKLNPGFQSRFNGFQRAVAMSLFITLFWTTGCGNTDNLGNEQVIGLGSAQGNQVAGNSLDGPQELTFYHENHIRTTSLVTDENGLLAARLLHLPFGEIDQAHSTGKERTTTKFASFTGQELDSAIGLLYYKSRYYDPSIGRFMSPDTVLPGKGMEPQGLNRYAYVFNNPIKYVDPTGHVPASFDQWLKDNNQYAYYYQQYMQWEQDKDSRFTTDRWDAERIKNNYLDPTRELYQQYYDQASSNPNTNTTDIKPLPPPKKTGITAWKPWHSVKPLIKTAIKSAITLALGAAVSFLLPGLGMGLASQIINYGIHLASTRAADIGGRVFESKMIDPNVSAKDAFNQAKAATSNLVSYMENDIMFQLTDVLPKNALLPPEMRDDSNTSIVMQLLGAEEHRIIELPANLQLKLW